MPLQSERKQSLINYIQEEQGQYLAGTIPQASSLRELAERFGYKDPRTVSTVIKGLGIIREGVKITDEKPCRIPGQSEELSWFIGIIAGNDTEDGSIRKQSDDSYFLQTFRVTGEHLFEVNGSMNEISVKDSTTLAQEVTFRSRRMVRFLGNLSRGNLAETFSTHHEWILRRSEYVWAFLAGYFDSNGQVIRKINKKNVVQLSTISWEDANFFINLLTNVGIVTPSYLRDETTSTGLRGVTIANIPDIRRFAQKVRSFIASKDEKLEFYRQDEANLYNRKGSKGKGRPNDVLLSEWKRCKQHLGRIPTCSDIKNLRSEEFTAISDFAYAHRFGGGSFVTAREVLEGMIAERELQSDGEESMTQESQIFP